MDGVMAEHRPAATDIILAMGPFSSGGDPERAANIAFLLIFLGIVFVGGLTIWLFYGAQF